MGDLTEARELAAPQLVEDLPRLLLGELIDLQTLIAREEAQRAPRDIRVPHQRLIRADEPVAPERDAVPRDAGGGVGATFVELEQRTQVERAARDESLVERLRARRVARARAKEAAVASIQRVERIVEATR